MVTGSGVDGRWVAVAGGSLVNGRWLSTGYGRGAVGRWNFQWVMLFNASNARKLYAIGTADVIAGVY